MREQRGTTDDATTAARWLATSRRPLVTGLGGLSAEAVVAACDLAEHLGAAIDAGDIEMARSAGPTIARAGEVTADREELRDRADLVIFWFCDPHAVDPTFVARFVTSSPSFPHERRTLAVGPHPVTGAVAHVPVRRDAAVDAARAVRNQLLHGHTPPGRDPLFEACAEITGAIDQAACVAVITDHSADPLGLEPWSIVHLIRTIAHRKPAFEIPLAGQELRTAAAVLTWRYGAAGAIATADRAGGNFLPGEASAARLIERGEVDCVVAVGTPTAAVERAIADRADDVSLVRLGKADPAATMACLKSLLATLRDAAAGTGDHR